MCLTFKIIQSPIFVKYKCYTQLGYIFVIVHTIVRITFRVHAMQTRLIIVIQNTSFEVDIKRRVLTCSRIAILLWEGNRQIFNNLYTFIYIVLSCTCRV